MPSLYDPTVLGAQHTDMKIARKLMYHFVLSRERLLNIVYKRTF